MQRDTGGTTPVGLTVAEAVTELQAIIAAGRAAEPFVHWRDDCGRQLLLALRGVLWRITIGRGSACDIALTWDAKVSRSHALLEPVAGGWTVVDDGLSRNGTFLNGTRFVGRQRLADGDRIDIGGSRLFYREPTGDNSQATAATNADVCVPTLSATQSKVLVALCRPVHNSAATPATNRQIAAEVCLSVDAVKVHLRVLCDRFGLSHLPQNEKRAQLAHTALAAGLVLPREF